jgi:hypothetical protein
VVTTPVELTLPTDNTRKTTAIASKLGGWKIIVPASWQILLADETITGYLESNLVTDSIELLSVTGNTYVATQLIGNIEFSKGILLVNGFTLLSKIPNKLDEGIMLFVGFKSIVFPLTSIKVVT